MSLSSTERDNQYNIQISSNERISWSYLLGMQNLAKVENPSLQMSFTCQMVPITPSEDSV